MKSCCFELYRRLFYLVHFVKCWQFFLELNSNRLYQCSGKEKESRCLVFTSPKKREIRKFYVVVVQWRQKSCCFANLNQFAVLIDIAVVVAWAPYYVATVARFVHPAFLIRNEGLLPVSRKTFRMLSAGAIQFALRKFCFWRITMYRK